jgi:hypothetical protein
VIDAILATNVKGVRYTVQAALGRSGRYRPDFPALQKFVRI